MEYRIKSAFLFNFCKFVSWPESSFSYPEAPLILYILGNDPFGSALESLKGKKIRGHAFEIEYAEDIKSIKKCHLLFVSNSMAKQLDKIISHTQAKPIVTVGDMEGFAHRGGMINFYKHKNKIRFEINPEAATLAAINISSQLLKLAKITPSRHPEGH